MGALTSVLLSGTAAPGGPANQRMPRLLLAALILAVASFLSANAFYSPLTPITTAAKWASLAMLLLVSLMAFITLPQKPTAPPLTSLLVGSVVALAIAGLLTSVDVERSLMTTAALLAALITSYCVSAVLVATNSRRDYIHFLATCGRVLVIGTLPFALLNINLGRGLGEAGLDAWTDNPNTLALMLAPGTVVFFAGCLAREPGWLLKHALFFVISAWLIWKTDSRATIVWLFLSVGTFWLYRRGITVVALAAIAGAVCLTIWWDPIIAFLVDSLGLSSVTRANQISPLSGREEVWAVGWDYFRASPLSGHGIGSSEEIVQAQAWRFYRHQGLHFHNSYLTVLVEIGLPALIAFGGAMVMTIATGLRDAARTAGLPHAARVYSAVPLALLLGAAGHAVFESWLTLPGNANMLQFWIWFWLIHHQSQVGVRPAPRAAATEPAALGAPLPAS